MLRVPANLDLAGAAPLLCAGITTYSPMRHWGVTKGKKVGVVGLGGLGHMGVKFAHAFGAHTVVFTTSPSKKDDALRLGADEVVISKNADEMAEACRQLRLHSRRRRRRPRHQRLHQSACAAMATSPWSARRTSRWPSPSFGLIFGRRSFSGSPIGGIAETQEMLDFCGKHNITSDVEVIPIQKVNEAYERMLKSDVKYRFSIDMASFKSE